MNGPILLEPKSSTTKNAEPEYAADAAHATTNATNATADATSAAYATADGPAPNSKRNTDWSTHGGTIVHRKHFTVKYR